MLCCPAQVCLPLPACQSCCCVQAKDSDLQRTVMMMKLKESRLARLTAGGWRGSGWAPWGSSWSACKLMAGALGSHSLCYAQRTASNPEIFAAQVAAATCQQRWRSCSRRWSSFAPRWMARVWRRWMRQVPGKAVMLWSSLLQHASCHALHPVVILLPCWPAPLPPGGQPP